MLRPSFLLAASAWLAMSPVARGERLLIVHANDTHGHALPFGDDDDVGGMARLATVVKQWKAAEPNTLFLGAGDTFEGTLFYNVGLGRWDFALFEMMTPSPGVIPALDGLAVGNHDFAVGTQKLYDSFTASGATYPYLAANINLTGASKVLDPIIVGNETDGVQDATPYVIRTMPNGLRVGMFGLLTSETATGEPLAVNDGVIFYDTSTTPNVYQIAQGIADRLRNVENVDVVIALDHLGLNNGAASTSLEDDSKIAQNVTGIDVIVGGHDHAARPTVTTINGIVMVYAGAYNRYAGVLDLDVNRTLGTVTVTSYELRELGTAVAEDATVKAAVDGYKAQVEAAYPGAFSDVVAANETLLDDAQQAEVGLGNLVTDAYRAATGTDVAIDMSGSLRFDGYRGPLYPADIFNILSVGFDPTLGDVTPLTSIAVFGNAGGVAGNQPLLKAILELTVSGFLTSTVPSAGRVMLSGVAFEYDPTQPDFSKIQGIWVGGVPFDPAATYTVATEGAVASFLSTIDLLFAINGQPNSLAANATQTTEVPWRTVVSLLDAYGRVTCLHNGVTGRLRTLQPDLGFASDCGVDVEPRAWVPSGSVEVNAEVLNFGMTASAPTQIEVYYEQSPSDPFPNLVLAGSVPVPAVSAHNGTTPGRQTVTLSFTVPGALPAGMYPVQVRVIPDPAEAITVNDIIDIVPPKRGNIIVGGGRAQPVAPVFSVLDADGAVRCQASAYGGSGFGLDVSAGELDGLPPGREEGLTAPGPGAVYGPHIRAWNASVCPPVPMAKVSFYAYGTLRYGARVDAGDIDGDGTDEILTGAGPGAVFGPHVRAWNFDGLALSPLAKVSFFAYGNLWYGCDVAAGDIDGDGYDEILTMPGPGVVFSPQVRGINFDGTSITSINKVNFYAFSAFPSQYGGNVDASDVDGDRYDEIVAGRGPGPGYCGGGGPTVCVYDYDATSVSSSFCLTPFTTCYGASVGSSNRDGLPWEELVTGPGPDPTAALVVKSYREILRDSQDVREALSVSLPGSYGSNVHGGHFGWGY